MNVTLNVMVPNHSASKSKKTRNTNSVNNRTTALHTIETNSKYLEVTHQGSKTLTTDALGDNLFVEGTQPVYELTQRHSLYTNGMSAGGTLRKQIRTQGINNQAREHDRITAGFRTFNNSPVTGNTPREPDKDHLPQIRTSQIGKERI